MPRDGRDSGAASTDPKATDASRSGDIAGASARAAGDERGTRDRGQRRERNRDRRDDRSDRNPASSANDAPARGSGDDIGVAPGARDRGNRDDSRRNDRGAATGSSPAIATGPTASGPTATGDDGDDEAAPERGVAWGTEDDSPAPPITLAADLPADDLDDPEPLTRPLADAPTATLGDDVACVTGVRFAVGGRVSWLDAGDADYRVGERVMADSDRGPRLGWIAVAPAMRGVRDRNLRRVIRRANDQDLERDDAADRQTMLRAAKDAASALRLPLKVFRVEGGRNRLLVYYTSDERLDLRDFIRNVSNATSARVELRQLGVRDEAKAVGGIGTCGLTLCCTTWLPDFVPVSIKMAKDQGLVLSPTKVSGQCGRLKCCLVYEQAGYAEMRKGLPKLGKRVIAPRGEGRVVEVDVLRQRVRVSYGPGDSEVLPATEVRPMFPPQNAGARAPEPEPDSEPDDAPDDPNLPSS